MLHIYCALGKAIKYLGIEFSIGSILKAFLTVYYHPLAKVIYIFHIASVVFLLLVLVLPALFI